MPSATSPESNWSARLWWTLAGVGLLDWAFQILSAAPEFSWAAIMAMLAGAWGLGTVLVSWTGLQLGGMRQRRWGTALGWGTALVTVLCFASWAVIFVHGTPAYGTDELAFDQYAGELLRHGLNPYTHSLGSAFAQFSVSPGGYTYTLTGQRVMDLSYPALSFLLYVPFLALGWSAQLGIGLNVIGWSLTTLISFAVLPRDLRAAALVLGSVAVYMELALIGLTDMLFLPLLVVAAYRWDRFGSGWRSYVGPIAFGLAMAVKQTPWPILPFILLALALDEQRRTDLSSGIARAARYLLAVVIAFVLPNLPFMIASPSAWAHGTFTPIARSLVPAGQGLVGLTLFLHLGGGSLQAYSLLLGLALVLLLITYMGTYPLLRTATFMLPALAYFFAPRSYTDYLVALIPPALVAAVTIESSAPRVTSQLLRSRRWGAAIAATAAGCLAISAYALASRSPLGVRITRVELSGANNIGNQIHLRVHNRSGTAVSPAFTLESPTGVASFWHVLRGPQALPAGATANYLLGSPDTNSQFSVNGGITVLAFLQHPTSVSVSNRYSPQLWHVGFTPESFDALIPLGRRVVLRAQLLNRWDLPITRSGVPIRLHQSRRAHARLASINGRRPGRAAVSVTNARGIARFTIVGAATSLYPDTLSVSLPSGAPYQYLASTSSSIELRFTRR